MSAVYASAVSLRSCLRNGEEGAVIVNRQAERAPKIVAEHIVWCALLSRFTSLAPRFRSVILRVIRSADMAEVTAAGAQRAAKTAPPRAFV